MTRASKRKPSGHGLVQATADLLVDQARALADLVASAGTGAMGVLPGPVSATVTRLLTALEQLVEEVPSITDELDVLVEELHAKRLSIAALRAELSAMDAQLEVLERTLAPVQSWSHQWNVTRKALASALRSESAPNPPH